jgi:hypothetical protein
VVPGVDSGASSGGRNPNSVSTRAQATKSTVLISSCFSHAPTRSAMMMTYFRKVCIQPWEK